MADRAMKLTDEQHAAIGHPSHALVNACPGSGKTRAIIAKLLRCVDNVRETPRRVACITYTNSAVHKIENRVRLYGATGDNEYCEVATIHSFCQANVLRYFYWRLPEYPNGYSILPSDSQEFAQYVQHIGDKYALSDFQKQQFELLSRAPNGAPLSSANIPATAAIEFWQLLQANCLIDFCNIVYYSYRLLADYPNISRTIATRFKHILIDEFQDTTAIQVEILKLVANVGVSNILLVGDPEQSIYSFAGADRSLMFAFASYLDATEFPLSGNFRSSGPVIQCAEALIPRTPAMFAAGPAAAFTEDAFYANVDDYFAGITDYFLPTLDTLGIPVGAERNSRSKLVPVASSR